MLDIQLIRRDPDYVAKALAKRGFEADFAAFLQADEKRRKLLTETEQMKAKRNKLSATVPQLKKAGEDASEVLSELKTLSQTIKERDEEIVAMDEEQKEFLAGLPNIPAEDVPAGGKENNQVEKVWGEKREFDFKPQHHVDIAERLGIIDYTRGAKLSGYGFWIYRGDGARLEWAILNYFIETHLRDNYEMMLVPHILNQASGFTAGQFPKFKEDVYWLAAPEGTPEQNRQFILPTAETALVNIYRDEILEEKDLPRKFFAYSPCYRREAGSHRAEERGMIRGHQFNKVEIFQYTTPEQSPAAFEEMVRKACELVEGLGLHYRLSRLAAGDCSASMAKTWDIEVWIPSMNGYKEVSSASNARDYQARRGNMRYRRSDDGKLEFMHTLNASGLATSRILPAILEQNQQEDGTVVIPEVLRKYMGGQEVLKPREA